MFNKKSINRGFTLIELMVAVSVFSIALVLFLGSILSVFDANQKSKTLRSVMDNLSSTLESMTREIRFATNYHCTNSGVLSTPLDCGGLGDSNLTVRGVDGTQVSYSLSGGQIMRKLGAGALYPLTSPDVTITKLTFRVYGSPPYTSGGDTFQPQVIVVIGGFVGTKAFTQSTFTIETTISQRVIDSQ